ncbi:putative amidase [Helianthus annuus]|uniref:Amidase n=1 Tax=Helianthus annuus TaxID=4232 RepID=A0A251SLZ4_HELAN|nr:amidase 1 [Helianthus annuus]KAF5769484.1 putative amidase [Helianthus annuus]KAJ0469069.1 putative amidase [Helianthus annuus]KAJ0486076.1 putative amidase [Helianthus annuus]
MTMTGTTTDYGAFMEKFILPTVPTSSPLNRLTFAVKDIFDMEGYVSGFGNPDWLRTHAAATSTAPAVSAVLDAGAICLGRTVMDEMAYSINGENVHYGTPVNPCAPDRVPGGSSSGSAVAVGAELVDFSLGTDTGGSVRVPASYCGIFGFRPSHGVVSTEGVIPMAQSFDTVGWFARDPVTLNHVGQILLQLPNEKLVQPSQVLIAEDCFKLFSIPSTRVTNVIAASIEKLSGGQILQPVNLGDYVESKVPSLNHFRENDTENEEFSIKSLTALSAAMRLLQRFEFKKNHGEWVSTVKPNLGPGLSERILDALNTSEEHIGACESVKTQLQEALAALLGENGVIVIPTVPGPPPKLQTETTSLETFRARAFSLLSIAGVSGFCQVTIPLGKYNGLPVSVSLMAKHGSDGFLLNLVEALYPTMKEQVEIVEKLSY